MSEGVRVSECESAQSLDSGSHRKKGKKRRRKFVRVIVVLVVSLFCFVVSLFFAWSFGPAVVVFADIM